MSTVQIVQLVAICAVFTTVWGAVRSLTTHHGDSKTLFTGIYLCFVIIILGIFLEMYESPKEVTKSILQSCEEHK